MNVGNQDDASRHDATFPLDNEMKQSEGMAGSREVPCGLLANRIIQQTITDHDVHILHKIGSFNRP